MRIIAKSTLKEFWKLHNDAEQSLLSWYEIAKKEQWKNFNDIKKNFPNASIMGSDKVVFNIKGNRYRLIVKVKFDWSLIFIKFISTHSEYDKIDVKSL